MLHGLDYTEFCKPRKVVFAPYAEGREGMNSSQSCPSRSRPSASARAAEAILPGCARRARRPGITRVTLRAETRRAGRTREGERGVLTG